MYIREDLAYNLICYNNKGVIKADEFRKNLGITNNESVRREKDRISTVMKILAKKIWGGNKKLMVYFLKLICVFLFIN